VRNDGGDWKMVEQPELEKGVENLGSENGKRLTKIDDKKGEEIGVGVSIRRATNSCLLSFFGAR
jgi:hypothetical protein